MTASSEYSRLASGVAEVGPVAEGLADRVLDQGLEPIRAGGPAEGRGDRGLRGTLRLDERQGAGKEFVRGQHHLEAPVPELEPVAAGEAGHRGSDLAGQLPGEAQPLRRLPEVGDPDLAVLPGDHEDERGVAIRQVGRHAHLVDVRSPCSHGRFLAPGVFQAKLDVGRVHRSRSTKLVCCS